MSQLITSFIVRCHIIESDKPEKKDYRIKLTHVQEESELSFDSFEEAMNYMKQTVNNIQS
ncbi:hypothetical protein GH741_13315 [Aquibacillus halophilus]|uniref:Uncharacterized protein n=1 Tax=Aquibacillus halophilus TaxID=930132 RepID=A0A6A8DIS4_9BACI|nr:hypothetical protein [Aquibacillus halophilus]MRH43651.1 hypothetical protein [Aquibacillus halophilus]